MKMRVMILIQRRNLKHSPDSGAGESGDSMLSSKTDSSLRKQIENHFGDRSDIAYANVTLNNNPVDSLIVGYKEIYDDYLSLVCA